MMIVTLRIALILVGSYSIARLLEFLAHRWLKRMHSPIASSGMIRAIIRSLVMGIAFIIVLSELGVQIGPLLTALGVGGLAAALAVRDTLENFFSGLSLLVDQTVRCGDRVRLEIGQEGVVQDIGWRTSRLLMENGDMILIPNTKLIQGVNIRRKRTFQRTAEPARQDVTENRVNQSPV